MADVPLKFQAPADPDIAKLRIEEAPAALGPWTEIETVVAVGIYPDYITEYTTELATNPIGWFRIRWEDTKGALGTYSEPMQGGTTTLVATVKDRVMQRDPTLVDVIVYQEAEAVISQYFSAADPYAVDPDTVSYTVLSGLTNLVLARSLIMRSILNQTSSGTNEGWTVGLVSVKSGVSSSATVANVEKAVEALLDLANLQLGIAKSFVLLMEELYTTNYLSSYDHSRLIGWVGLE